MTVPHTYTLPGVSKKEAESFARTKHEELKAIADRVRAGLPGSVPMESALTRYEDEKLPLLARTSEKSYRETTKVFRRFLAAKRLSLAVHELRRAHAKEFLSWARLNPLSGRAPASPRTLERHRAVLHAFFSWAEEFELVDYNPITKVKPPKYDPRDPVILTDAQLEALLSECEHYPMLRMYLLALAETGMRSESEALWLQWEDVDLEEGFIRVVSGRHDHRTKTGRGRWIPMTPRLRSAMREHFRQFRFGMFGGNPTPWVFHHTMTRMSYVAGERVKSMRGGIKNAVLRAKLPEGFRTHDLRHRRVTAWLAEGKNPVHVKEALGHSTLQTTMGYTHLAKEHLRALVAPDSSPDRLQTAGEP